MSIPAQGGRLSPPSPDVLAAIREEASRDSNDPVGAPLPLAAHWNPWDRAPKWTGFGPTYQREMISAGHRLLPWFQIPYAAPTKVNAKDLNYYEEGVKWCAAYELPVSFINVNWEEVLYSDSYSFFSLPPDQNPNVIGLNGTIQRLLDPLGPVAPWREAGRLWGSSDALRQLQAWYPNPPRVLFVSNNEAARLTWTAQEQSKRFVTQYGTGGDFNLKMYVTAHGWIERYKAFLEGFRNALSPAWGAKAVFVGFDAFGPPHFARWWGWHEFALPIPYENRIDPSPFDWDGGSPAYYLHNWNPSRDDQVWGPQGEGQNWVFMLQEALSVNPKFWFELSTWDGEQGKRDQLSDITAFKPERYGAMIQFGMWLLQPRVAREFRHAGATLADSEAWFQPIMAAVNRVHTTPALKRFWRAGQLVPNRAWQHPYQAGTWWYAGVDRWFLLDTTLDPPHPYDLYTRLPVLSLARVLGAAPQREWLVYAHAPQGSKANVGITIPDYGQIRVDVPVGGAFYLVREGQPGAQLVA